MLNFLANRRHTNCEGTSRRDFLKIGALGTGMLTLPDLLRARAEARAAGQSVKNTSVIWLWLGGGPTHVETFDPKMTAPAEYRSVTGEVATTIPGVTLGGTFSKMASVADKMAFVRSFAHTNSGHGGGTHWVMTGYDDRGIDNGGLPSRPSLGSIVSRSRGANNPLTGMPTYVRMGGITADGPAFLGTAFAPFDPAGQARRNMSLVVDKVRLDDRRSLLKEIDTVSREADRSRLMEGLDAFEQQAFNLVLSKSQQAFDLKYEDPRVVERYGRGLGERLLTARRLCEAGCGFVTVEYGGWDMHGNIKQGLEQRGPELDQAVAALVEDMSQRGQDEDILLVVTGEFGRTPKINKNAGRDHWGSLMSVLLAGGRLQRGVFGESNSKGEVPANMPYRPENVLATIYHHLGIDPSQTFTDLSGRPRYVLE
ncbi:MAG: DUF1501 domain-containing protein, partial [Planctomycetales bacterium]|nr:DUF1501 domain-containing protein [Planctomycetales bacterium]